MSLGYKKPYSNKLKELPFSNQTKKNSLWLRPIIKATRSLRQEDGKFKVCLSSEFKVTLRNLVSTISKLKAGNTGQW